MGKSGQSGTFRHQPDSHPKVSIHKRRVWIETTLAPLLIIAALLISSTLSTLADVPQASRDLSRIWKDMEPPPPEEQDPYPMPKPQPPKEEPIIIAPPQPPPSVIQPTAPPQNIPQPSADQRLAERPMMDQAIPVTPPENPYASNDPMPLTTAEAENELRYLEKPHFIVVGMQLDSVHTMSNLATEAIRSLQRRVTIPKEFTPKILIQLVPAEEAFIETDYKVYDNGAETVISYRWDASITLETAAEGIIEGIMRTLNRQRYGEAVSPPVWLKLAMLEDLRVSLSNERLDYLTREAKFLPYMKLDQILNAKDDFGIARDVFSMHAYWLMRFFGYEIGSKTKERQLFEALSLQRDSAQVLTRAFPEYYADESTRSMWWAVGVQGQARSQGNVILSLGESRRRIQELAAVTAQISDADYRFSAGELWEERAKPEVQQAVIQNLREIKMEIPRVNPLYYNSLLSLGQMLEALAYGDEDAYHQLYQVYQKDMQQAHQFEQEIYPLLKDQ